MKHYLGYNGAQSKQENALEVSRVFAEANQLVENEYVTVQATEFAKVDSVHVKTLKSEDYEILNLRRQEFECLVLNNIQILYQGVVFPIYYQSGQYVMVTYDGQNGMISENSEIVVEQMEEKEKKKEKEKETEKEWVELEVKYLYGEYDQLESTIYVSQALNMEDGQVYHVQFLRKRLQKCYKKFQEFQKQLEKITNRQKSADKNNWKEETLLLKNHDTLRDNECLLPYLFCVSVGLEQHMKLRLFTQPYRKTRKIELSDLLSKKKIKFHFMAQSAI